MHRCLPKASPPEHWIHRYSLSRSLAHSLPHPSLSPCPYTPCVFLPLQLKSMACVSVKGRSCLCAATLMSLEEEGHRNPNAAAAQLNRHITPPARNTHTNTQVSLQCSTICHEYKEMPLYASLAALVKILIRIYTSGSISRPLRCEIFFFLM